jgi:hypothetical protein
MRTYTRCNQFRNKMIVTTVTIGAVEHLVEVWVMGAFADGMRHTYSATNADLFNVIEQLESLCEGQIEKAASCLIEEKLLVSGFSFTSETSKK